MSVILRGAAAAFQSPTDLSRQTRYTQFNRSQPPPANARQIMAVIVRTPRPASRFGRRLGAQWRLNLRQSPGFTSIFLVGLATGQYSGN
jgi:hypothetical protein